MEWVGGLKIKVSDVGVIARNKINYYPHSLGEFVETFTKGNDNDLVEINFDDLSELNKAKQVLNIG
jgi:hypothetical protein